MGTDGTKAFSITDFPIPYEEARAYHIRFKRSYIPDLDASPDPDEDPPQKGRFNMRRAVGRALIFDPNQFELKIYPFHELIHRSWRPGTPNFVRESSRINLGTSLHEFIFQGGGPELKGLPGKQGVQVRNELDRCIFACNTLQTGFIRGNGFVVAPRWPGIETCNSELIRKPDNTPGLFDPTYAKLNGCYDVIELEPHPSVGWLRIEENESGRLRRLDGSSQDGLPTLAICSPIILDSDGPVPASKIPYRGNPKDPNDPASGSGTEGNEVNWKPWETCTSFTALGVTGDQRIVAVSMLEGSRIGEVPRNRGMLATEMGWLLKKLGASSGVIGGGSADTQQFLDADAPDMPKLIVALFRPKDREEAARSEVEGPRGLGAIFAVLQK